MAFKKIINDPSNLHIIIKEQLLEKMRQLKTKLEFLSAEDQVMNQHF